MTVLESDRVHKEKQKLYYNKSHGAHSLPEIPDLGEHRWATRTGQNPMHPDCILVPSGMVKRNRQLLVPELQSDNVLQSQRSSESQNSRQSLIRARSRTGTSIHPPDKLNL